MLSGTVPDYLFIYVFLFISRSPECYVFRHCARLFVYLCFFLFPEVQNVMFSGTVPDYLFIYVFLLFSEVQNVMFSGTVHF